MAHPVLIPIGIGVAVLGATAVGLRVAAVNKQTKLAGTGGVLPQAPTAGTAAFDKPVIAPAVAFPPASAPPAVQAAAADANLKSAIANPAPPDAVAFAAQQAGVSVADLEAAAKFIGDQSGQPNFTAAQFIAMGVSPRDITDAVFQQKKAAGTLPATSNPAAAAPAPSLAQVAQPQRAIVTTNDPAPSGDLIIRDAASASADQIGGAEKDGTVTVLDSSDATFAQIQWDGGNRLPPATGFARKAFLKLV